MIISNTIHTIQATTFPFLVQQFRYTSTCVTRLVGHRCERESECASECALVVGLGLLLHQLEPARALHRDGAVAVQRQAPLHLEVPLDITADQLRRALLPLI